MKWPVCGPSSDRVAAERLAHVDPDQAAVDVAELVAGEVQRKPGDIVSLNPSPQWH